MKKLVVVLACVMSVSATFAELQIRDEGGQLSVWRDGRPLVARIVVDVGKGAYEEKSSFCVSRDGSRVWNRWCEDRSRRFRFEAVERSDGAIELSLFGEAEPFVKERLRALRLEFSKGSLEEKRYEALKGNGRDYRPESGAFDSEYKEGLYRWLTADGVIYDFNSTGAGEYNSGYLSRSLIGVWNVTRKSGRFVFSGIGQMECKFGGYVGTKIVIREGTNADYAKIHFLRAFHYRYHLTKKIADVRQICFGSPKHGRNYEDGDHVLSSDGRCGWVDEVKRVTTVGSESGVYYSNVGGKGSAVYRFSGLFPGYYILTVHVGNWKGTHNGFSVTANGEPLAQDITVPRNRARTISRAVHVKDGNLDVGFGGDWIVSAISVQPLLSDAEDFSVGRAFWFVDGYEPATLARSVDYANPVDFRVADEQIEMPPPGRECEGERRMIATPVELPDPTTSSLAWLKRTKTRYFLENYASFGELDDPKVMKDYVDAEFAGCDYNSVRISGMHSRHTYINHVDRGVDMIGRFCEEFHHRGLRVIDHHDATLLWNFPAGFRVMMERLDETIRGTSDGMPAPQFCPNNRRFRETYWKYLRRLVEKGVDGFNLDEVEFWAHGCQCAACREDFHRDTGWWMPLDETHPALKDFRHPLAAALYVWRVRKITNWFVGLRRYLKDIKPDLTISAYVTHYGLIRQLPREYASVDLVDQSRAMNLFGTECMSRNNLQSSRSLVPYRRMFNIFTARNDVPVYGTYYCSDGPSAYFAHCVANSCGQVAFTSGAHDSSRMPKYEQWMTSKFNMNREGAVSVAEIALLFSVTSRDWNRYCGFGDELFGTAQELEAMHVPYDFVYDPLLSDQYLRKYKVLVLCASNCLTDEAASSIRRFAERGGTVLLSSLTGLFDGVGERRAKAAFGDITGYDPPGVPKVEARAIGETPEYREVPVGKGRFVYFPKLVANRFWARECTPGEVWKFNADPSDEQVFRKAMADILRSAVWWKVSAPDRVITSIWREKDGTLAVHFLNELGSNVRPGEVMQVASPEPAFPRMDKDIVFTLPCAKACRVTVSSPEIEGERILAFVANRNGTITVTLPKELLGAYALVRIRH